MVRGRARVVNCLLAHDLLQVDALCVQHPLVGVLERAVLCQHNFLGVPNEYLVDIRDTAQLKLCHHVLLHQFEEIVVSNLTLLLLLAGFVVVHHTNMQNELLSVVVAADARQQSRIFHVDLFCNLFQTKLLINHHFTVENNAQEPWRQQVWVDIVIWHVIICLYKALVLTDASVPWIRIIVNLCACCHTLQGRPLKLGLHVLGTLTIACILLCEVDRQARRLHTLGNVDDLLQTRHAKCHVLR
mmetsp:Transcript_10820/g.37578  ORF Transcript_10820/g.37578 Transcript_10820/m.37578 type:complete len:243 (+) Transcript_10820:963-1691(+)